VVLAVVVAASVAGCSSSHTASPPASSASSKYAPFLASLKGSSSASYFAVFPDSKLESVGDQECEAAANGDQGFDVIDSGLGITGATQSDVAHTFDFTLAAKQLCPTAFSSASSSP
jgi:hypothetical protein